MRLLLVAIAIFALPFGAAAYSVVLTKVDAPYENIPFGLYAGEEVVLLGELSTYPVMYEFDITDTQSFTMRVRQAYQAVLEPDPLSLLLVRVESAGASVREVGRVRTSVDDWAIVEDPALGMTFFESESFSTNLATGTYRVEVSSPVNEGRYALVFGVAEGDAGYFTTLGNIRATQKHFGYSVFRMIASPYVFYPLGILALLVILQRTWKYRKLISNVG